jgi:hypothetical protein
MLSRFLPEAAHICQTKPTNISPISHCWEPSRIPLYVRGKGVSEEKGEYAADGLREAVRTWEESSERLNESINGLLKMLT